MYTHRAWSVLTTGKTRYKERSALPAVSDIHRGLGMYTPQIKGGLLYVFSRSYNSPVWLLKTSFVFQKVILQLKAVVSPLPTVPSLFFEGTPCFLELSLTAALMIPHKELASEWGEV